MDWLLIKSDLPTPHLTVKRFLQKLKKWLLYFYYISIFILYLFYIFQFLFLIKVYVISPAGSEHFYTENLKRSF